MPKSKQTTPGLNQKALDTLVKESFDIVKYRLLSRAMIFEDLDYIQKLVLKIQASEAEPTIADCEKLYRALQRTIIDDNFYKINEYIIKNFYSQKEVQEQNIQLLDLAKQYCATKNYKMLYKNGFRSTTPNNDPSISKQEINLNKQKQIKELKKHKVNFKKEYEFYKSIFFNEGQKKIKLKLDAYIDECITNKTTEAEDLIVLAHCYLADGNKDLDLFLEKKLTDKPQELINFYILKLQQYNDSSNIEEAYSYARKAYNLHKNCNNEQLMIIFTYWFQYSRNKDYTKTLSCIKEFKKHQENLLPHMTDEQKQIIYERTLYNLELQKKEPEIKEILTKYLELDIPICNKINTTICMRTRIPKDLASHDCDRCALSIQVNKYLQALSLYGDNASCDDLQSALLNHIISDDTLCAAQLSIGLILRLYIYKNQYVEGCEFYQKYHNKYKKHLENSVMSEILYLEFIINEKTDHYEKATELLKILRTSFPNSESLLKAQAIRDITDQLNKKEDSEVTVVNEPDDSIPPTIYWNYDDSKIKNIPENNLDKVTKPLKRKYLETKQKYLTQGFSPLSNNLDETVTWKISKDTIYSSTDSKIVKIQEKGGLNYYACIDEEILSQLDSTTQNQVQTALNKGVRDRDNLNGVKLLIAPINGEAFFELKINSDCRLIPKFIYENEKTGELLIIFTDKTNHTGIAKAINSGNLSLIKKVPPATIDGIEAYNSLNTPAQEEVSEVLYCGEETALQDTFEVESMGQLSMNNDE